MKLQHYFSSDIKKNIAFVLVSNQEMKNWLITSRKMNSNYIYNNHTITLCFQNIRSN